MEVVLGPTAVARAHPGAAARQAVLGSGTLIRDRLYERAVAMIIEGLSADVVLTTERSRFRGRRDSTPDGACVGQRGPPPPLRRGCQYEPLPWHARCHTASVGSNR